MTDLIFDSAKRLFAQYPVAPDGRDGAWDPALWQAVEEAGFPLALLSEDEGGYGLEPADAFGLLHIAAAGVKVMPLGETMLANWLLAKAGLVPAEGPAAIARQGASSRIAYGRYLKALVLFAPDEEGLDVFRLNLPEKEASWIHGANLAGEPRDFFSGKGLDAMDTGRAPIDCQVLNALFALIRVQQIAGALQAVLDMTVQYATERVQFGKPISKFQAIQQYLAVMAGETAAARAGAAMAAEAFPLALGAPEEFRLTVAAAKLRAGEAAGTVAALAHQVHGAIGVSREYGLHLLTRRLWAWRDEHGREADWGEELGRCAIGQTSGLWPFVTNLQASFF